MVLASVVLMTRSSQLAVSALQSWKLLTDQDGSSWHKSKRKTSSQLLREFYIITLLGSSCVSDVCQSESDIYEPYDTDDRIIHDVAKSNGLSLSSQNILLCLLAFI